MQLTYGALLPKQTLHLAGWEPNQTPGKPPSQASSQVISVPSNWNQLVRHADGVSHQHANDNIRPVASQSFCTARPLDARLAWQASFAVLPGQQNSLRVVIFCPVILTVPVSPASPNYAKSVITSSKPPQICQKAPRWAPTGAQVHISLPPP